MVVLFQQDNVRLLTCIVAMALAVWAHLEPIFDWNKCQRLPIYRLNLLSDEPVDKYLKKYGHGK